MAQEVKSRGRRLRLLGAVCIGFACAAAALTIGMRHNPQGEFYDLSTGRVDVAYCATLFAGWFVPTAGIAYIVIVLVHSFAHPKDRDRAPGP